MLVNIGWAYLVTWLPTYLSEQQHVEAVTGAHMVSVVLAVGMVGQLAGGWLCDTTARRFGLRWGRVLPLAISGCFGGSAYLLCPQMNSAWGVVACCAAVSFATDLGSPATWAFTQDVGGRATAAAAGWGNLWGNFGASISSLIVPWLLARGSADDAGQTTVFLILASAFFLSGVMALGMDATKPLLAGTPVTRETIMKT